MNGLLLLQDGSIYRGNVFGAQQDTIGEIVFNTSMTGYQEIITDPSYYGQIVTMTFPMIGIYGTNEEDIESNSPKAKGLIVREIARTASNFASDRDIVSYFEASNITGIENVDTRSLTKHIRTNGAMNGIISTSNNISALKNRLKKTPNMRGNDLAQYVSPLTSYAYNNSMKNEKSIAVIDCGVKYSILQSLKKQNVNVKCYPARFNSTDILKDNIHGLLVSNGPGDPEPLTYTYNELKKLIGKLPMFGICLGHQLLSLALGGKTYKLKFGHRGANHPVMDLRTGKIDITSQNHGFCVDMESFKNKDVEITHVNLNDQTCEGMRCRKFEISSVQYHPEASPGPHDSNYLLDEFISTVKGCH